MRRAHFVMLAALILWLAPPAAAQTGRVQGVVKDANGRWRVDLVQFESPKSEPATDEARLQGTWLAIAGDHPIA